MSLTSFLKVKEVKEKFRETFKKPSFILEGEILAHPKTENYGLVGTAFDYLMRFILEYHNPNAITCPWVAEQVPEFLSRHGIVGESLDEVNDMLEVADWAPVVIKSAKKNHKVFLESGEISRNLLNSCITLAQTDVVYRTGKPPKNYAIAEEEDINDLFELSKAIKIENFIAKDHILLNPTFGEASRLVGGADADIIMDGVLIDIKTTKYLEFKREYFDQLIGYYILSLIGEIDGIEKNPEVKELGIYFSRHGKLVKFSVDDVLKEVNLNDFIDWFTKTAKNILQDVISN